MATPDIPPSSALDLEAAHQLEVLVAPTTCATSPTSTMATPDIPPSYSALDLEAAHQLEVQRIDPQPGETVCATSPTSTMATPDIPPSYSALDLEAAHQLEEQRIDPQPGGTVSSDWAAVIIAFCLTSAVEIALQSLQPQIKLPLLMHLLSLAMLFAFASVFVSNFISFTFPNFRRPLMLVAKLSIFTAFLFALTVPFPLSLKLMSWSLFGLCLLIIVVFAAAATRRVPNA